MRKVFSGAGLDILLTQLQIGQWVLGALGPSTVKTVHLTVNGLKCAGTSRLFAQQIADAPGVVSLTTYARTHAAIVE